jgi:CBS domain-containing protein
MERAEQQKPMALTEAATGAETPDTQDRRALRIGDIMSRDVVTACPGQTIFSAAKTMSDRGVSCVVVLEDDRIVGILTEKDILRGVATQSTHFGRTKVAQGMTCPVETIVASRSIVEAGRMMDARRIRRLPVVENGRLVGLVTQTDITRGLISLSPLRYISDIMTRTVATVDIDATAEEAAAVMAQHNISCVAVLHREEVAGICTEKDLLKRVVALEKDPSRTRIAEIMSFPVVVVPPSYSILSASKKMESMHLHRLLVMEEKTIRGIVTRTDILRAIRSTFEALESQQRILVRELADLVRYVLQDMERVQQFLGRVQEAAASTQRWPSDRDDAREDESGRANFCLF